MTELGHNWTELEVRWLSEPAELEKPSERTRTNRSVAFRHYIK